MTNLSTENLTLDGADIGANNPLPPLKTEKGVQDSRLDLSLL